MRCETVCWKTLPAHRLQSGELKVTVTDYGSKIQSIQYLGREYLHQSQTGCTYRLSDYGSDFRAGEFSGFDEMFPNISAGPYPDEPWHKVMLPDHGEVWSRIWQSHPEEDGLHFTIDGHALPYRLEKTLRLDGETINLTYQAANLSGHALKCIWAAHPLFILEDGMHLELPGCREIINVYGGRKFLGDYGAKHPWPISLDGRNLQILDSANHTSNKYYAANPLTENTAVLRYPAGTVVRITAPVSQVPYLGVWTDEAGEDMCCVAPEPCTGAFDTLEKASEEHAVCSIPPGGRAVWSLQIQFLQDQEE